MAKQKCLCAILLSICFSTQSYAFWIKASGPKDFFMGSDHGDITSKAIVKKDIYSALSELYRSSGDGKFGVDNSLALLGIGVASTISAYNEDIDGDVLVKTIQGFGIEINAKDELTASQITGPTPEFHCDDDSINNCSNYIKNTRKKVGGLLLELISDIETDKFKKTIENTRKLFGYATHTLQDFYSHSNWIEKSKYEGYSEVRITWGEASDDLVRAKKLKYNDLTDHVRVDDAVKIHPRKTELIDISSSRDVASIFRGSSCKSEKETTHLYLSKIDNKIVSGWYHDRWEVFNPKPYPFCVIKSLFFCDLSDPDSYPETKRGQYYPEKIEEGVSGKDIPVFYLPKKDDDVVEYCQHGNTFEGVTFIGNGLEYGIHKDSPHRHMHEEAANTAQEATTEYLVAILEDVVTSASEKGYRDEYTDYVILKFLGHDVEPPPPVQEPPETPDGVQVEPDGDGLKYSFNKSFGANSYNVFWKQGTGVTDTNSNVVSIVDDVEPGKTFANLQPGKEYCFKVSAVNEAGESELSNEICNQVCDAGGEDCSNPLRPRIPICIGDNCSITNPNDPRIKPAFQIGDPHISTLDRFGFDLHMHGEIILTKSSADAANNLEIQARPQQWRNRNEFSADVAYAMRVNEDIVGFYLAPELIIHVNSESVTLVEGYNDLPSGGQIYKYNNNYTVIWLDNSQAGIRIKTDFMEIKLYLASRHQNKVVGIFGNYDSDPDNDMAGRDGSLYLSPIEFNALYKEYGHSWRITDEESLFDYFEPGKNGTEAYTDLNYPTSITEIDDFTDAERIVAEQLCNDGGVTIETPILFKNCVIDVAATDGEDLFSDSYRALYEPIATLEVIPPKLVIIITSPTPDTILSGNVVFRGTIRGLQNVANLNVSINGGDPIDLSGAVDGDNFAFTLSSLELSEGDNRIIVTVVDSDGNIGTIIYDVVFDSTVAPAESGDIIVINDINMFDDPRIVEEDNIQFVGNLVSFSSDGLPRSAASNIVFDRGRNSTCGLRSLCDDNDMSKMRQAITNLGFTIVNDDSSSGSLTDIDAETKVIFFWNPEQEFTIDEISALKKFSNEGGRIIWIGEHAGFYGNGIPIQNQFLEDMGVVMRNIGGIILTGAHTISIDPGSTHQSLESVQTVHMNTASEMELGPNDFALIIDPVSGHIIAAVAKANINQP